MSSPTDDEGGVRNWLAVYERLVSPGNHDLAGTLGRNGTLVRGGINLTTIENGYPSRDQVTPHVDSDGCRFTVVRSEFYCVGNQVSLSDTVRFTIR